MRKLTLSIFIVLCSTIGNFVFGQTNSKLSIQGVLRNSNGSAVENGKYDITFRLWDAATNGNQVWMEEKTGVDVEGGIYSVVLGDGTTQLNATFTEQYYLGVSVEGGSELIPRAPLTSSPYALSLIGSDNIFPNSGNVGIGDANPQAKLSIKRGNGILGLEVEETVNNTSTITTTSDGISFDAGGANNIYAFPNGRIQATADEQFTIEGTNDAKIIFSKNSGNASLGFDATNGDKLILTNSIGATHIEGNNITLNTSNGNAIIEGTTSIEGNGETLQLVGTDSSVIAFYPEGESAGRKGFIGFMGTSNNDLTIQNDNENGKIKIGTNSPAGSGLVEISNRVDITGYTNQYFSNSDRNTPGSGHHWSSGTRKVGLRMTREIVCPAINFHSDIRIKKDFQLSKRPDDLAMINQLEVTNYRHIDEATHGTDFTKGFIAQQVKSVFPEAVKKSENYIPSILTFPTKVERKDNLNIITLAKNHDLKKGDKIKVMTETNQENLTVTEVLDSHTFAIAHTCIPLSEKVFFYGKEVNDFHSVDYNRIYTLNVSATQELSRKVELLEKENALLQSNYSKTNDLLKTLNAKVDSLSQTLEMTGEK